MSLDNPPPLTNHNLLRVFLDDFGQLRIDIQVPNDLELRFSRGTAPAVHDALLIGIAFLRKIQQEIREILLGHPETATEGVHEVDLARTGGWLDQRLKPANAAAEESEAAALGQRIEQEVHAASDLADAITDRGPEQRTVISLVSVPLRISLVETRQPTRSRQILPESVVEMHFALNPPVTKLFVSRDNGMTGKEVQLDSSVLPSEVVVVASKEQAQNLAVLLHKLMMKRADA